LYNVYEEEIFSKRVLVQEDSLNITTLGAFDSTSTKIITAEMKGTEMGSFLDLSCLQKGDTCENSNLIYISITQGCYQKYLAHLNYSCASN